jgi:predicted TIM-barrel fold metal-dependent hydrolase
MGGWLGLHRKLDAAAFENPQTPEVQQLLAGIETDLRDRGARAIGEIHVNALTTTAEPANRFKTPADSATLKAVFALAGKYGRPLNVHAQWDPDTVEQLGRPAASAPDARLVVSHCGSDATAADMRRMFEQHPNVSCDLSARGSPIVQGRTKIFDERQLDRDWKKLIEDYPDRFVVGIDTVHDWQTYEGVVRAIRLGLLANLSPETAQKLASANAEAWFGLR